MSTIQLEVVWDWFSLFLTEHNNSKTKMASKDKGVYSFSCISWVLITVVLRGSGSDTFLSAASLFLAKK